MEGLYIFNNHPKEHHQILIPGSITESTPETQSRVYLQSLSKEEQILPFVQQ